MALYGRLLRVEDFGPAVPASPGEALAPALPAALAVLTADGRGGTIEIASAQALPGSASIPSNVGLRFVAGGSVSVPNGATLTINGPLVAPPVQIFTGSGTVAFGPNAVKAGASPEWWGAVADHVTDCTAALNTAATAASKIQLLGNGSRYRVTSTWTVPAGVQIVGDFRAPPRGPFDPGSAEVPGYGSTLDLIGGAGSTDPTQPGVMLHAGATIDGVMVYHPDQADTNPPISYPPAIAFASGETGGAARNCTLVNSFIGLWAHGHEKFTIDHIYGQPLNTGIDVDDCTDVPRINDVHFWAGFWRAWTGNASDPISAYMQANLVGYKFARVDGLVSMNLTIFGCLTACQLTKSSYGNGYGSIANFLFDGCKYGIRWDDANFPGWAFTGGSIHAYYGAGIGACIHATGQNTYPSSMLSLMNVEFYGGNIGAGQNGQLVQIDAGTQGFLRLQGCDMVQFDSAQPNAAVVKLASGSCNLFLDTINFDCAPGGIVQLDVSAGTSAWTNTIAMRDCRLNGGLNVRNNVASPVALQLSGNTDGQEGTLSGRMRFQTTNLRDSVHITDLGTNGANIELEATGGSPKKYLRSNAGNFDVLSDSYSPILRVTNGGLLLGYQGMRPNNGPNTLYHGSGAPSLPGGVSSVNAGDYYFRSDTPSTASQRIYVCTVGGAAPTWVGIV